jgi:uncharacterized membrane protein
LASDGKWYPPDLAPGAPPASPTSYAPSSYAPPAYTPPTAPAGADVGTALSYGWRKFTANVGPLLAIILIPLVIQTVLSIVGQTIGSLAAVILFTVISQVIGLMASIGIFNAGLMLTAGEPLDIGRAFSSDRWGEWIVFALVWGLMVAIGVILCGVGALVVIAIWGFAPFYFIDRRMSLGEALSASSQATAAVPGLRVSLALTALVGILGIIACGIGILATLPMAYIGAAYLYRVANNQPVAA